MKNYMVLYKVLRFGYEGLEGFGQGFGGLRG
jgi:hypothetical protein